MQSTVQLNKIGGGGGAAALTTSYTSGASINGPARRQKIRVKATKNAGNAGIKVRLVDLSAPASGAPSWDPLPIPVTWTNGDGEVAELELCTGGTSEEALGYVDLGSDLHGTVAAQAVIDGADASADNTCVVEFASSGLPSAEL